MIKIRACAGGGRLATGDQQRFCFQVSSGRVMTSVVGWETGDQDGGLICFWRCGETGKYWVLLRGRLGDLSTRGWSCGLNAHYVNVPTLAAVVFSTQTKMFRLSWLY